MNRSRRRAKRKRLDFPRRNRGLSSSSNSGLIRCPLLFLTTLTLSSGSPRFSSAILFSIVFVCDVFRFYRLLLPNFWLPLSSQDGKRRRPKPRTRRFPYRVPEYCYDRGSERKKKSTDYTAHRLRFSFRAEPQKRPRFGLATLFGSLNRRSSLSGLRWSLESLRISHFFTTFRSSCRVCCMTTAQLSQNVWLIFSIIDWTTTRRNSFGRLFFSLTKTLASARECVNVVGVCVWVGDTHCLVARAHHYTRSWHRILPAPKPFESAPLRKIRLGISQILRHASFASPSTVHITPAKKYNTKTR